MGTGKHHGQLQISRKYVAQTNHTIYVHNYTYKPLLTCCLIFSDSKEERLTMHSALKQNNSVFSRYYLNEDFNEIKFDFELVDDIIVGENFRFKLIFIILTL
jgi:transglutaminase 1